MKVRIYYDNDGHIIASSEIKTDAMSPLANVLPINDCHTLEVELAADQEQHALVRLHTENRVDLTSTPHALRHIRKSRSKK